MKMLLYVAAMGGFFTLPQCTINKPVTPSDLTSIGYFPDKVGYQWVYKVTDSLKNVTDTVTVSITGTKNDSKTGETFKVWQYKWLDKIDTTYEERKGDTIRFYTGLYNYFGGLYLPVPSALWTGNNWKEINIYILPFPSVDTLSFDRKDISFLCVRTGESILYTDIYGKQRQDSIFYIQKGGISIPNDYLQWNESFVPFVGMISQRLYITGFELHVQKWKLLYNNFLVRSISTD